MNTLLADAWILAADGRLVRADVIAELACQDGVMTARLTSGREVSLAGPGCPAGFHRQFLAALELARLSDGDRWTVIITACAGADGISWTWATSRVSGAQPGADSTAGHSPSQRQITARPEIRAPRALRQPPSW